MNKCLNCYYCIEANLPHHKNFITLTTRYYCLKKQETLILNQTTIDEDCNYIRPLTKTTFKIEEKDD